MEGEMTQKIFNLGFSKTGTTTFENALDILGYQVCRGHWKLNYCFYLTTLCIHQDYDEIFRMIRYWDAFADGPWGGGTDLYKELHKRLPDSKFVLTIREPESWYRSFEKQIMIFDRNPETAMETYHANGMWGSAYWFEHVFDIKKLEGNKQKILDKYSAYNADVVEFFKDTQADFMVFDIFNGDGWEKLCSFLGKAIPDVPFPQANKTPLDWKTNREINLQQVRTELFCPPFQQQIKNQRTEGKKAKLCKRVCQFLSRVWGKAASLTNK